MWSSAYVKRSKVRVVFPYISERDKVQKEQGILDLKL
jgi:hypothetical protein